MDLSELDDDDLSAVRLQGSPAGRADGRGMEEGVGIFGKLAGIDGIGNSGTAAMPGTAGVAGTDGCRGSAVAGVVGTAWKATAPGDAPGRKGIDGSCVGTGRVGKTGTRGPRGSAGDAAAGGTAARRRREPRQGLLDRITAKVKHAKRR